MTLVRGMAHRSGRAAVPRLGRAVGGWVRHGLHLVEMARGEAARDRKHGEPANPETRLVEATIAERLEVVRGAIAAAASRAGRDPASIRLVAVTKTVDPVRIAAAISTGVTEIGENRVQEALSKQPDVVPGVRWHLVGHLQSNKAALAAQLFDTVHSLDGVRVGEALDRRREAGRDPIEALVEVDYTGIAGRTGIAPEEAAALLRSLAACSRLRLAGLMTIAPFGDEEAARAAFRSLHQLRDRLEVEVEMPLPELSMGMSDDFELAITEGATMVRLGRIIFGERPPVA